jgi:protein gp37
VSENSTIEWTDATWPVTTGCDDESPGCLNCYSKRDSHRLAGNPNRKVSAAYAGTTERRDGGPVRWTGHLNLMHDRLDWPLTWKKSRRIFVGNMSDLFHPAVPDVFIEAVAQTMRRANWHTFQVLTKRSARLRDLLRGSLRPFAEESHIWWGVSVEDRRHGLPRVEHLREAPANVRFLSVEPLLEDLGEFDLSGIHWVIVGGESGPRARPMKREWVVSIRDQCVKRGVPFFFKQWGGVRKKEAGRTLDGRTYDEMPPGVQDDDPAQCRDQPTVAAQAPAEPSGLNVTQSPWPDLGVGRARLSFPPRGFEPDLEVPY